MWEDKYPFVITLIVQFIQRPFMLSLLIRHNTLLYPHPLLNIRAAQAFAPTHIKEKILHGLTGSHDFKPWGGYIQMVFHFPLHFIPLEDDWLT